MHLFRGAKSAIAAGIFAATAGFSGVSQAGIDFRFDWAAAGCTGCANALSPVTDELKFTAESVLAFNGTPFAAGVTFTNYLILRVDQLFNNGIDWTEADYGGPGATHEITIVAEFTGTQNTATTYSITGFNQFDVILDYGQGYTFADFADASTFANQGSNPEGATFVLGAGTNAPNIPDGAVDFFIGLLDKVNPGDFEVTARGTPIGSHLLGVTNANTALCGGGTQTCFGTPQNILDLFGGPTYDPTTMVHTRDDGTVEKFLIPEPGAIALLGIGLVAGGFARRRTNA